MTILKEAFDDYQRALTEKKEDNKKTLAERGALMDDLCVQMLSLANIQKEEKILLPPDMFWNHRGTDYIILKREILLRDPPLSLKRFFGTLREKQKVLVHAEQTSFDGSAKINVTVQDTGVSTEYSFNRTMEIVIMKGSYVKVSMEIPHRENSTGYTNTAEEYIGGFCKIVPGIRISDHLQIAQEVIPYIMGSLTADFKERAGAMRGTNI